MRILIVEDEKKTAALVARGLGAQGYETRAAASGERGLAAALEWRPDLVILDLMLPGLDGFGVLKALRASPGGGPPVIILTARDEVDDRVRGLEAGAEDYLVKPFAFAELLARVRARLRPRPSAGETRCVAGDLELDRVHHTVLRGGVPIELTGTEFSLLDLLMNAGGEPVSRDTLAREVWGLDGAGDSNALDVAVHRLRRKLDDEHPARLIHAVRGVGYRFAAS